MVEVEIKAKQRFAARPHTQVAIWVWERAVGKWHRNRFFFPRRWNG